MSVASLGTLRRRAEQQIAPCSRVPSNSTVSYRVVSYRTAQHTSSRPSIRLAIVYIYIAVSPVRKSRAHPATLDAQPWSPAHARAGRSRTDPFPPPQRSGLHPDHAPGPHPTSTPGTTAHVHPSSESTPGAQKWYVGSHTASTTLRPPSLLFNPSLTLPPLYPITNLLTTRPDRPLQLPLPPPRRPPHHLHLHLRAPRFPRHHGQKQRHVLLWAFLEVREGGREDESLGGGGVRCHGGMYEFLILGGRGGTGRGEEGREKERLYGMFADEGRALSSLGNGMGDGEENGGMGGRMGMRSGKERKRRGGGC